MRFLPVLLLLIGIKLNAQEFIQTGKASYYADKFEGRRTANGAVFSNNKLSAAHRTLPFGTQLVVTNLINNKQVIVIINDRGPFIKGRIIDVSQQAAKELDFLHQGITDVRIEHAHQPLDKEKLFKAITPLPVIMDAPSDIERLSKALMYK